MVKGQRPPVIAALARAEIMTAALNRHLQPRALIPKSQRGDQGIGRLSPFRGGSRSLYAIASFSSAAWR